MPYPDNLTLLPGEAEPPAVSRQDEQSSLAELSEHIEGLLSEADRLRRVFLVIDQVVSADGMTAEQHEAVLAMTNALSTVGADFENAAALARMQARHAFPGALAHVV